MMKNYFLVVILLISGCYSDSDNKSGPLISIEQLNQILSQDQSIALIDFRPNESYLEGHIPGALNAEEWEFHDQTLEYGGVMATKDQIELKLSLLSVSPDDFVVVYDDNGNVDAARLWFLLKYYGHQNVALLDGGFRAWNEAGFPITSEVVTRPSSLFQFQGSPDPGLNATMQDVIEAQNGNVVILDVRTPDEFTEQHIPGAINLDWAYSINYQGTKTFKSKEELIKQFSDLGITGDQPVITYCRSGMRASHTAFVLREILGFEKVKVYDGSFNEWTYFEQETVQESE